MNVRTLAIALLVCLVSAGPSYAQADRARGWLAELSIVEAAASADSTASRQARVAAVRKDVDDWLALNPGAAVDLPKPPDGAWTEDQLREQIALLRTAIERLLASDPNQPFYLGITAVNVTAPGAVLSPVSDHLDQVEIRNHDALTVNQAIEYLPGVSVDHKAPRNQTGISIGGFDGRQVPLYLDGIPAYLPFDGYVDLTRYLTSDLAQIQVAKGYSSPLLGPNVMGGVVNLVTRQPQKDFEGEMFAGTAPGGLLNAGVHVGSRGRRFFVQGSADRLQSDFFPISGSFVPNAQQPGDRRVNSFQRDERYRVRAGWTPKGQDSYVLSYSNQQGETGVPPYSGSAPACPAGGATLTTPCVTPKYWQWPEWNTDGLYFNSRTALGEGSALQFRAFHVRYANTMAMFDDATYSTMNLLASSGTLDNRDRSVGVSGDFETRRVRRHAIGASFFVKEDTHREQTTTVSRTNVVTTTPSQTHRDRQSSFGIQDVITVSSRITATAGISADHLNGLQAQDLSSDRTHVVPFQVAGICTAASESVVHELHGARLGLQPRRLDRLFGGGLRHAVRHVRAQEPVSDAQGPILLQGGPGGSQSGTAAGARQHVDGRVLARAGVEDGGADRRVPQRRARQDREHLLPLAALLRRRTRRARVMPAGGQRRLRNAWRRQRDAADDAGAAGDARRQLQLSASRNQRSDRSVSGRHAEAQERRHRDPAPAAGRDRAGVRAVSERGGGDERQRSAAPAGDVHHDRSRRHAAASRRREPPGRRQEPLRSELLLLGRLSGGRPQRLRDAALRVLISLLIS